MSVYDLIKNRRSIRRYLQKPVEHELLCKFVDAARLAPSGANLQPLKFYIIDRPRACRELFSYTKWAAYLPEWNPAAEESPTAYIAVCVDKGIKNAEDFCEIGAAVQNILLMAEEAGLGTCWLGAIDKPKISAMLGICSPLELHTVIGIGYPAEHSVYEPMQDSVKYYYDGDSVLHVPKRAMEEVLLSSLEEG